MPEVVARFAGTHSASECTDSPAQSRNCSLPRFAQTCLEFAEWHLDWIQVRRVLRQITKRCTPRFNRLANTNGLVRGKIVDHDDVVALESGSQTLFNIGQEPLAVHCTVKRARRPHASSTQSSHKRDGFPVPLRHPADQALTAPATTAQTRHLCIGGRLGNEYQPSRIKHALFSHPSASCPGHVGTFLLRCAQAFFESEVMALKETPNRGAAATNLVLAHFRQHLVQRHVRLCFDQSQQEFAVLFQGRSAPAPWLRRAAASLAKTLYPGNRRTGADIIVFALFTSRSSTFHPRNHPLPHVGRIGLLHRPASQKRINVDRLPQIRLHENPSIQLW